MSQHVSLDFTISLIFIILGHMFNPEMVTSGNASYARALWRTRVMDVHFATRRSCLSSTVVCSGISD